MRVLKLHSLLTREIYRVDPPSRLLPYQRFPRPASIGVSLSLVASLLLAAPTQALAQSVPVLPQGGSFVAGAGAISTAPNATLNINQSTARGVIDWRNFSIGAGGRVLIDNGSGATLNRVNGGDLSRIDGLLKSTGSVYLINPNGIIVGEKGCVSAGGSFVASTRSIATDAFMAGGPVTAAGNSSGNVVNQGSILARLGDVILIGQSIENTGSLHAPQGTATLAAGNRVLLTTVGGPSGVFVAPDNSAAGSITQTGRIAAAAAALKAAGGDIYTLAGNRSGLISATGTTTINGEVWLSAPNGKVLAGGDITARNANGTGGQVVANGASVTVPGSARISAAGSSGGAVLIGVSKPAGTDLASSTTIADGASITAGGPAGGGFVETSGHAVSLGQAAIAAGTGGTWSVDPVDLTINAAAASTIASSLNGGTNVIEQTTSSAASGSGVQSAGPGDITVASPITWTGSGALTLSAYHDLKLNANIAGTGAFTGLAGANVAVNSNLSASNVLLTAAGGDLTLGSGVTVTGANGATLQASGRFLNNSGATALSGGTGRWLVYSANPATDTPGGVTPAFLQYAATTATTPAAAGNGLLYSVSPSLSVALSGTLAKTYDGTTAAALTAANATTSGLINTDTATVTGSYGSKNAGTGIAVTASNIAVSHNGLPVYGYAGTTPSVSANIGRIDPATLTASIVGDPTKTYNATTTATLTAPNYQLNGFVAGEGASVNQPSSVAYDAVDVGARTITAAFSTNNFVPTGGTLLANYITPVSATGAGHITPAPLLITGVQATNKVYDRTTVDALDNTNAALFGIIGSDDVSLVTSGATGTFSTANAGSGLAVTASGFALTGAKAFDYAVTPPTGLSASISRAPLSISGVSAFGKVYDSTTAAALNTSGVTLLGVVSGDSVTLGSGSATGTFASPDVATGIAVSTSGFSLSGTPASNYALAQPSGLSADITTRPLSVAIISNPTKIYNGDTGVAVDSSSFSLTGFAAGQSATIGQTSHIAYDSANAGNRTVTATLSIPDYTAGSGTKLSNYSLPGSASGAGLITPAPVAIAIDGNPTKNYDGTNAATLASNNYRLTGLLAGQSATVTKTSGLYSSPNAGARQVTTTLGASDLTPGGGTLLSNYAFPTTVTGFGTILPAPISGGISATIIGNPTKTYDGTTTATLTPSNFQLFGFASGEGATVTQTAGQYGSKNAGVQPITASLTSPDFTPDSGTNLSNYTLPNAAYGSGTINPALLTASIIGNPTKIYNGTTDATLGSGNFGISGLASGEGINIGAAIGPVYDARQAGSRTITTGIASTDITAQSGTLLANYILPNIATGPGQINQAPLVILGVSAQNKTYDTTTAATLSNGAAHLYGSVVSDDVTLSTAGSTAVFASPNASANVATSVSGYTISGTDAANYQLFQPVGLAATIFRAPVSISGVTAANKYCDNTNTAILNTGSVSYSGVLAPDSGQVGLSTAGATGAFSSVNVGHNLPVTAGGFSLTGSQSSNYALSQPSGLRADLMPQPLTATIIGNPTKVYDGSDSTTLTAANYQIAGFVAGQGATIPQSASVNYLAPDAGPQNIASVLAASDTVANAGTNLSNYVLPTSATGTGTITQAQLTALLTGNPTKTYDSTPAATLTSGNFSLSGFVAGQGATVTQTSGAYNTANAGSRSVTATLSAGQFTSQGVTNLNNYILPTSALGTGTITQAALQTIGVTANNRTYNGGLAATLDVSSAGVSGLFGSDTVTLGTGSATGVFASKDVASGIGVTASGFTVSGGASSNYLLAQPTGLTADITPATLNLTKISRIYDSTTGLPTAPGAYTLSGLFGSDAASVNTAGISGNYADKNVGVGKNVTLTGLALSGAQAGDYIIASSLTNAAIGEITKAPLTVSGASAVNKVYDAATVATLDNSSAAFSGLFAGDAVTLNTAGSTAAFLNRNVANGKSVTASGYTASGADFSNYNFTQPTGLSANITPLALSLTSITKIYDGGNTLPALSAAYALGGVLGADSVQAATGGLTGSYNSVNVGSGLGVNLSGLALSGTDAANYSIPSAFTNAAIGIINPKALSAAIIGNPTKTYNATTAGTLGSANYSLSGFVSGESATVTKTSGTYNNANAGSRTISTSLVSGDFNPAGGTALSNYILPTTASGAGQINRAVLNVAGVLGTNKVYDGAATDALDKTSAALTGVVAADSGLVTLNTAAGTGTFASPNAATGVAVIASGFAITGSQAANYLLTQPAALTADITQAALSLASVTKVYDATASAVGAGVSYSLAGIVGADSVALDTAGLLGSYAAKNVGTGLSVSLTGMGLTGAQASNYSIASNVSNALLGTITPAPLTVTGSVATNKVYNGTNAAVLDQSSAAINGILGSDTVNLSSPATGTFSSANAGTWTVTPGSAYTVSGTDAGNYTLTQPSGLSATITRAPLAAAITGNPARTYNGTTAATLAPTDYSLTGFIAGQSASVGQAAGTYDTSDAGSRTVTASLAAGDFTPAGGTLLANYFLPAAATGAGLITPKAITAAILGTPTRTYNGLTAATLAAGNYGLTGFVAGQGATVTQVNGLYDTANAGSRTVSATLSAGDFTAAGATNFANYVLPTTATGAGLINPKALTAAIIGNPGRIYDGTTAATLASGDYGLTGFIAGQGGTVTKTTGLYDSSDAGSRTVSTALGAADITAAGATNLANYTLPTTAAGAGFISPKTLTASITGDPTKIYDAATGATLTSADYTLNGFVAGQGGTVTRTTGTYDAANAGSRTVSTTLGAGDLTAAGGTNFANYVLPTTASGLGQINQKALTAAIVGTPTRIYDGTAAASLTSGNYSLSGFVAGQGASVTQTAGTYTAPDAGSRTVSALLGAGDFTSNGGTSLANYLLPTSASGAALIDPRSLVATLVNASKVYDGNTAANLASANYLLAGFVAGQSASINQTSGTYALADAGARAVTATLASGNFTAGGATNLANYTLPTTAAGVGTITPKSLVAAIIGNPTKTYDGATSATLASVDYALSGFVAGQGGTVTQTLGAYSQAGAGARAVSATLGAGDITAAGGTNLANYSLPATASGVGHIDPKTLTVAITGNPTRSYDSTTAAALAPGDYTLSGFVTGEGAAVTQTAGTYSGPDAGLRTVSTTLGAPDFTATGGTSLSNYVLPISASGTGTIDPRTLIATVIGNPAKTYDGLNSVTLTPGNYLLNGFVAGQGGTVTQTAGTYSTPDAGFRTVSATLAPGDITAAGGTNLSNYALPVIASGLGTIDPRTLAASIVGHPVRSYDGTTAATLAPADYQLTGFVNGQNAAVTQTAGTYNGPNAGSHAVTTTLAAGNFVPGSGTNLANYVLPEGASGNGSIDPKTLTATIVDASKTYDGSTASGLLSNANFALSGFAPGQGATVSQTAGVYASPDAGSRYIGAALSTGNILLTGGALASNYILPTAASGVGLIRARPVSIALIGNPAKTYDGTVAAVLASGNYLLSGFLPGQGATATQSAGTYDSANAGSRTLTASLGAGDFIANSGTNLNNYILPPSAVGVGSIDPRTLSAGIINTPTRMSDGSLTATLSFGDISLSGFLPGQGATVVQPLGAYDSAAAGSRTITAALGPQNFTAGSGTLLSNYLLPASASGPGTITPAIRTDAPTLTSAIMSNASLRNLASPDAISTMASRALYATAVPRMYIPYPTRSALATWQNNAFGLLPTVLDKTVASTSLSGEGEWAATSGPRLLNTTEQILLQGNKDKSWHMLLPTNPVSLKAEHFARPSGDRQ